MIYYSRIYTIGIQCEAKLCFWSAVKLFSMLGDKYICMLEVLLGTNQFRMSKQECCERHSADACMCINYTNSVHHDKDYALPV